MKGANWEAVLVLIPECGRFIYGKENWPPVFHHLLDGNLSQKKRTFDGMKKYLGR
jgi:hypothetical protein